MDEADRGPEPAPMGAGGGVPEPEPDKLSNIIKNFDDRLGNIEWHDADKIHKVIAAGFPAKVARNTEHQNAQKKSSN